MSECFNTGLYQPLISTSAVAVVVPLATWSELFELVDVDLTTVSLQVKPDSLARSCVVHAHNDGARDARLLHLSHLRQPIGPAVR